MAWFGSVWELLGVLLLVGLVWFGLEVFASAALGWLGFVWFGLGGGL